MADAPLTEDQVSEAKMSVRTKDVLAALLSNQAAIMAALSYLPLPESVRIKLGESSEGAQAFARELIRASGGQLL